MEEAAKYLIEERQYKLINLEVGQVLQLGRRLYSICAQCNCIVCINKRIFGSVHICSEEKEAQNAKT